MRVARDFLHGGSRWALLATVRGILFYAVNGRQMTLKYVGAIKGFLCCRARAWAKPAHHCAFVMGQCVPILIVFASKPFVVVVASRDRTFLGSFGLMCEHMCFQIFKESATVWFWATISLLPILIKPDARGSRASLGIA